MATNLSICKVTDEVKGLLKKFKLRKEKNMAAIVLKINAETMEIILDDHYENLESIDELVEELPSHVPRYVILSYVLKHADGRVSYPYLFIFISPTACKPELHMMYAGSKLEAVSDARATKVMELRSLEDLTEEAVLARLNQF